MGKWKKLMAMLLVGSMLFSAAGCGSGSNTDGTEKGGEVKNNSSDSEGQQAEGQPKEDGESGTEEQIELTMLCDWTSDTSNQANDLKSIAESLGYKLNIDTVDGDTYKTKIRVNLQANELPDIFYTWGGSYSTPFLESGALYPLENALDASGYELLDIYNQRDEEGHLYAMPNAPFEGYAMYYNKDVFAQIGMDVPSDWEELLAVVEACNEQGIGTIGLGNKERWPGDLFYNMMVLREDAAAFENAVNGDGSFQDEPFLKAAEKVQTLIEMNAFQRGYMQAGTDECAELLRAGQVAMFPHVLYGTGKLALFIEDENIGCTIFPKTGDEDAYAYCCGNAADAGLAVNAFSENADAAAKVIIEYAKFRSDKSKAEGGENWFATDVECTVELPEIVHSYSEVFSKMQKTQLWWYTYLDTAVGEPMRDLSHQQFAGQIEAQNFVEELDAIMSDR